MKKKFGMILAFILTFSLLTACSQSTSAPAPAQSQAPPASPDVKTEVDTKGGAPVNIVFWHAMGGRNGEAIDKLIKEFNESQNKIVIEAQYQGNYDEAITKLKATSAGARPDIMQLYDIGTRWMIDSKYALVMQDYINKDKYDISDYEANILAYYTLGGTLYSMPFNCSSPVIIYNKEALEAAGLDPTKAFATLEALKETAKALQEKGGMTVGGSLTNYSWVFEQLVSMQGKDFLDNGNGRNDRATKVIINENEAGLNILKPWKEISQLPYFQTWGKGTPESKKQFATGTVGYIFDSCSIYVDTQAAAQGKFSIGFAPLPKPVADLEGGTSVGGGSLWILDNQDDNKAAAAWEFIKFATQPKQQAEWAIGTGYLPIRKSAVELDFYQDYMKNVNPGIKVAIDSLSNSKPNYAGSIMGVFPQARVIIENELETMINDKSVTPEATLDKIVKQINEEITLYNKTN